MLKAYFTLTLLFSIIIFSGISYAGDTPSENNDETFVGVFLVMDDGIFLDDGAQLYLLEGVNDQKYSDLTVEVLGEYTLIDGAPAIKVKKITIVDDLPQDNESEESSTNNNG